MKSARAWEKVVLVFSATLIPLAAVGVANTAPVAYLPGVQATWEQRAEDMGVTVVFTDDARNCGALGGGAFQTGGCFDPATPDRIYVGMWLGAESLERVALHELAHAWYFAHGVDESECMADRLAASWGAVGPFRYCDPA